MLVRAGFSIELDASARSHGVHECILFATSLGCASIVASKHAVGIDASKTDGLPSVAEAGVPFG